MAQDIRELFRNEDARTSEKLEQGHKKRFEQKLDREIPKKKKNNRFFFIKVAAILLVALSAGFYFFGNSDEPVDNQVVDTEPINQPIADSIDQFQLSEISPEFKKVEDYYLASLNLELANLNVTDENRELIDSFMEQLRGLVKEYQRLNADLKSAGPNEQTIEAMIQNLQLRLELMFRLKNKLKEIRESKNKDYENLQA